MPPKARATRALLRVPGHEVMNATAPIASLAERALDVLDRPDRHDRLLPEILGTLARRASRLPRSTKAYRQVAQDHDSDAKLVGADPTRFDLAVPRQEFRPVQDARKRKSRKRASPTPAE